MSTQTAPSIRLTHTSPQQGLRLLELPRELLDVLSSDNAPPYVYIHSRSLPLLNSVMPFFLPFTSQLTNSIRRLELKYLPPSTTTTTTQKPQNQPEQEYINLCTPTKTYRVRQVQSSNSIHVLQPSNGDGEQVGADDNDNENDAMEYENEDEEGQNLASGIPTPSMTSIAKCSSTLELHTPQEGFSAVPFLLSMLRVYDRLSSEGGLSGGIGGGGLARGQGQRDVDDDDDDAMSLTKDRVFADIPVCKAQCERDWNSLCAFVCGGSGKSFGDHSGHSYGYGYGNCWRPSALVKLDVWKRVMEGAVLQGVNLEKQFLVGDLWKAMVDDEDGSEMVPRGLFEAVIRRVSEVGEGEGGNDYGSGLKCEFCDFYSGWGIFIWLFGSGLIIV